MVASPTEDCPTHRALIAEGVPHNVLPCKGEFGYGQQLARLWQEGEGFTLLEHDVIPWVGAIRQLEECDGCWCSFPYAKSGRTLHSLGFIKFSNWLVSEHPELAEGWSGEPWQSLEAPVLRAALSIAPPCEHGPAVGHAREPD